MNQYFPKNQIVTCIELRDLENKLDAKFRDLERKVNRLEQEFELNKMVNEFTLYMGIILVVGISILGYLLHH